MKGVCSEAGRRIQPDALPEDVLHVLQLVEIRGGNGGAVAQYGVHLSACLGLDVGERPRQEYPSACGQQSYVVH